MERARSLIDRNEIDVPFPPEDLAEFSEITGTDLRYAIRKINPLWRKDTRHIHVIAYDWTSPGEWSWRKAITYRDRDPVEADRARLRFNVLAALRHSIRGDLQDFRDGAEPRHCWSCGQPDDLTADHHIRSFISIAEEFLDLCGTPELRPLPGSTDVIADIDTEATWIAFHAARASYQLLCRSCNSKKGARGPR